MRRISSLHVFISKRRPTPVHHEVDAGHKLAGQVRGQEERGAGDVRGSPQPRDRRPRFAADIITLCFNDNNVILGSKFRLLPSLW